MLQQRRGRGGGRRCRLNDTARTFVIKVDVAAAAWAARRHAWTQMQNVASGSKQSKREGTEVANSKHCRVFSLEKKPSSFLETQGASQLGRLASNWRC